MKLGGILIMTENWNLYIREITTTSLPRNKELHYCINMPEMMSLNEKIALLIFVIMLVRYGSIITMTDYWIFLFPV